MARPTWACRRAYTAAQFGEGSYDKGIFVSNPFDLMLPSSHVRSANILWPPLLRKGGARLNKRYSLYDMTSHRDSGRFNDNLQMITR